MEAVMEKFHQHFLKIPHTIVDYENWMCLNAENKLINEKYNQNCIELKCAQIKIKCLEENAKKNEREFKLIKESFQSDLACCVRLNRIIVNARFINLLPASQKKEESYSEETLSNKIGAFFKEYYGGRDTKEEQDAEEVKKKMKLFASTPIGTDIQISNFIINLSRCVQFENKKTSAMTDVVDKEEEVFEDCKEFDTDYEEEEFICVELSKRLERVKGINERSVIAVKNMVVNLNRVIRVRTTDLAAKNFIENEDEDKRLLVENERLQSINAEQKRLITMLQLEIENHSKTSSFERRHSRNKHSWSSCPRKVRDTCSLM